MIYAETQLGREVREAIAKIMKRFEGCDIAAIKMSDVAKLDRLLNPEPDTFRIPVERCETPAYAALRQSGIDRWKDRDGIIEGGK